MTDLLLPSLAAADLRPGLLTVPGDAGWDEARRAWNLAVDQRPAAVAEPESADDVIAVVELARSRGLRVTAQGTGHNAGPLGDLSDVVLVKTHRMRGVRVDPIMRLARAEAGALWMDVVPLAAQHGLAAMHGSSPDVGVVGYTLGGGMSWYSRKYGTAASRVLAIELVTADGELTRASRTVNRDLFWALCGGGGSFGIVTAIEFELVPVEEIHAGGLWFPVERGAEVLHAWREWAPTLPDHVSTSVRLLNVPPIPEAPEHLRGRSFALVLVSVLGDAAEADRHVAPFRAMGPEMDTVVPTAIEDMVHLAMDPPNPVPAESVDAVFDELTPEAVDAIVAAADPKVAPTLVVTYVTLGGGAMARPVGGGASTSMDTPYLLFAAGIAPPELAELTRAGLNGLREAIEPHVAERTYLNFAEHADDPARFWDAETYARLRRIKGDVDPDGVIVANHTIPAA